MTDFVASRSNDPATSVAAGDSAVQDAAITVQFVRRVMTDGKPRIDEEIFNDAVALGFTNTIDRIRHGRLVLVRRGVLMHTGVTRNTSRRRKSMEWGLSPPGYVPPPVDATAQHCATCTCGHVTEGHESA